MQYIYILYIYNKFNNFNNFKYTELNYLFKSNTFFSSSSILI